MLSLRSALASQLSLRLLSSMAKKAPKAGSPSPITPILDPAAIRLRDFPATPPGAYMVPLTLQTASNKEIVQHRVNLALAAFQQHKTDSGSASVQIAVATEKILNMARHCTLFKKDKHSARGFAMMVSRRKKMMRYLKHSDLPTFKSTVARLKLEKEASHVR